MKFLLDTHYLIWALLDHSKIRPNIRSILSDPENQLFFSVSSIWEIAIKRGSHRPYFLYDPRVIRRHLIDDGYFEIPILSQHAVEVDSLPPIHKDPFDRILIAQAKVEGITLLTADATIAQYPGPIRKV
jgi:PIN domain nuclease of toxin-antitoxin system